MFFNLLYSLRLRQRGKDKLRSVPSKRGMFGVRSLYNVLVPHESAPFPQKCIWWHNVTLRAEFFAWTATLEKILAMDNLKKRHVIVVDQCCMCKKSRETVDLLLYCEITYTLWSAIFNRLGLAWVMPRNKLFRLLERVGRQSLMCSCMEVGSVLPFGVSWEGKKKLQMF